MASVEQIISRRDLLLEVTYILEPNFKGRETLEITRHNIEKSTRIYWKKSGTPPP